MNRNSALVITIGSFLILGCLLFPCWRWSVSPGAAQIGVSNLAPSYWFGAEERYQEDSESPIIIKRSGWTFVLSPPTPTAQIDWSTSLSVALGFLICTAGGLGLCRVRQRDKEVGELWKEKWQAEGDSRITLLRASHEPTPMAQTLLRAASGSVVEPPEQLLRASHRMGNTEN